MKDEMVLLGIDWGASALRAWAFDSDGEVLGRHVVDDGILAQKGDIIPRLHFHLAEWLGEAPTVPIIACGAVGGEQGLAKAGYASVPLQVGDLAKTLVKVDNIYIVPGLQQIAPPDVMRGHETVLFGLEDATGAVCIPGSHSRHVAMMHGRVLEFTTEMTMETLELLMASGGLIRPSGVEQTFKASVFRDWVERSLDTDDAANPFAIRAARILGHLAPEHHACALAGLLIGAEIAAHYDPGDDVLLVADGELLKLYSIALDSLGADVEIVSAEEATCEGLFELADEAGLLD